MHSIEKMDEFFAARVASYDEHMLQNVEGCKNGYVKMAEILPLDTETLLDLGCGTGLELDRIFEKLPTLSVTGIDLTAEMLQELQKKHPNKDLRLIHGDYFTVDLGLEEFDAAVSFQTMHHFTHARKTELYERLYHAIKPGGMYIEGDYMVLTEEEESYYFSEYARLMAETNASTDTFYHYDTPCTVDNQIRMLITAGFSPVEVVFREGNTTILIAKK